MMRFVKRIIKRKLKDDFGFLSLYLQNRVSYKKYKKISNDKEYSLFNKAINNEEYNKIKLFWKEYGIEANKKAYEYFYLATGKVDANYIPHEILYYYLLPKMNRMDLVNAYRDKNIYDKLFFEFKRPKSIARQINKRFYDSNYNEINFSKFLNIIKETLSHKSIIIKPSIYSGFGRGIVLIRHYDEQSMKKIISEFKNDFIIQEFLEQSATLNEIYPHSLNTIRIVTFEMKGKVYILNKVLKLGNNNNFLDKIGFGGFAVGINDNGSLNEFALGAEVTNKVYKHPQTNVLFKGIKIPSFDKVITMVSKMHKKVSEYYKLVSWDIAIDKNNEPILIEMNIKYQGVIIPQIHCGPLFGKYTNDILDYILK